jgi:valyl-tRNA synthetase
MPFITEELWQKFEFSQKSIMSESAPKPVKIDETDLAKVETMKEMIVAIRNIRTEMNVDITKKVSVLINSGDKLLVDFLIANKSIISELAKVSAMNSANKRPSHSSVSVLRGLEVYVPLEGIIDIEKERKRIAKEIENLTDELTRINERLEDTKFLQNAKPEVIEREKERKANFNEKIQRLKKLYEEM